MDMKSHWSLKAKEKLLKALLFVILWWTVTYEDVYYWTVNSQIARQGGKGCEHVRLQFQPPHSQERKKDSFPNILRVGRMFKFHVCVLQYIFLCNCCVYGLCVSRCVQFVPSLWQQRSSGILLESWCHSIVFSWSVHGFVSKFRFLSIQNASLLMITSLVELMNNTHPSKCFILFWHFCSS